MPDNEINENFAMNSHTLIMFHVCSHAECVSLFSYHVLEAVFVFPRHDREYSFNFTRKISDLKHLLEQGKKSTRQLLSLNTT